VLRWCEGLLDFILHMQEPDGRWVNFILDWDGTPNRTGRTSVAGGGFWQSRALVALVCAETGEAWTEIDVDAPDAPALPSGRSVFDEYSELVPVVEVDGVRQGYWRIDAQRLRRLPAHREWHVGGRADGADVDAVLRDAKVAFERQHYRVLEGTDADGRRWVGAERGRHRETGNLLFHIAVLVVLLGMAVVSLFGFKGTALVIVGNGFSNTITQYDGYTAGRLFKPSRLVPFNLAFTNFIVKFEESGATKGAAREFDATMQVTPEPGEPTVTDHLKVNHPLHIGNEQVHLIGHGYAPIVTVKDGNGNVAWSGPVAFLPQDGNFSSTGVIKVPDARPDEIGLQGLFLPSAHVDPVKGPISVFPDAENPALFLTAYIGNLGLDDGTPQSIYSLDTTGLTQLTKDGQPFRVAMLPGDTEKLPGNAGTITYEGYKRWANLQISSRPGTMIVLVGAVAALVGLMGSLFIPRRRAWVRVENDAGRTVIVLAGLDQRTSGGERVSEGLAVDLTKIAADLGDEKATAELDDAGAGDADADAENERTQS